MARFTAQHDGHDVEVDVSWTSKSRLSIDGDEVDSGSFLSFMTTLNLKDKTGRTDIAVDVHGGASIKKSVELIAGGRTVEMQQA